MGIQAAPGNQEEVVDPPGERGGFRVGQQEASAVEPGHWGPVGADVARCNWVSGFGNRCVGENAHAGTHRLVEPADPSQPQPQGDGVTRLRADIVSALRKLAMYTDADTTPRHIAWQKLAKELDGQHK